MSAKQSDQLAADRLALRDARREVDLHFGADLDQLRPTDRYCRGDLARTLLGRLGVSAPIERWQHARARALLGANYERIATHGVVPALDNDGVVAVPSIRERLIETACTRALTPTDLADAQRAFQRDAAVARAAELDWLAAHLDANVRAIPGTSETDARRQRLVNLWFNTPDMHGRDLTDDGEGVL